MLETIPSWIRIAGHDGLLVGDDIEISISSMQDMATVILAIRQSILNKTFSSVRFNLHNTTLILSCAKDDECIPLKSEPHIGN